MREFLLCYFLFPVAKSVQALVEVWYLMDAYTLGYSLDISIYRLVCSKRLVTPESMVCKETRRPATCGVNYTYQDVVYQGMCLEIPG